MIAIGGVIGQAEDLDRRARRSASRPGRPAGSPATSGRSPQPRLDLGGLRVVGCVDVDVRRQPAIEPGDKGPAEGFHHGADADIDREREQQRHQRQRQSRKLLAAVGPEPDGERADRALPLAEHDSTRSSIAGSDQRRAKQQRREHGKSRNQRIAEPQKQAGGGEHGERQRALQDQPAVLRLLPGLAAARPPAPEGGSLSPGWWSRPPARRATLMTMPAIHHSGFSVSWPGICAP